MAPLPLRSRCCMLPRTRPDGAKTVVRLMERRFLVALSVTVRTAAVKHNFAGGVSIQSLGVRVVIASPASRGMNQSPVGCGVPAVVIAVFKSGTGKRK